jgi:hypothetical protein
LELADLRNRRCSECGAERVARLSRTGCAAVASGSSATPIAGEEVIMTVSRSAYTDSAE